MHGIITFLATIFLLSSNSPLPEETKSLNNENDTVELISLESKIDTSFFNFFKQFMWEKNFQKTRVVFPIQLSDDKITKPNEWKHISFFTKQPYSSTLSSDTLSVFEKDVQEKTISMNIIDFEKEEAESFLFENINSNWYLKKVKKIDFTKLPDQEFIIFLTKFSIDSIFQINHITFPLTLDYVDSDNDYETVTKTIKPIEWGFWQAKESINGLIMLSNIEPDHKYRNIFFYGNDTAIWVKYIFEKIGADWKLIRLEDYSM